MDPIKWIKNKRELKKAGNYAEKMEIKALQKERDELDRQERKRKERERYGEKIEKMQRQAEEAELRRRIQGTPKPRYRRPITRRTPRISNRMPRLR